MKITVTSNDGRHVETICADDIGHWDGHSFVIWPEYRLRISGAINKVYNLETQAEPTLHGAGWVTKPKWKP